MNSRIKRIKRKARKVIEKRRNSQTVCTGETFDLQGELDKAAERIRERAKMTGEPVTVKPFTPEEFAAIRDALRASAEMRDAARRGKWDEHRELSRRAGTLWERAHEIRKEGTKDD